MCRKINLTVGGSDYAIASQVGGHGSLTLGGGGIRGLTEDGISGPGGKCEVHSYLQTTRHADKQPAYHAQG